MIAQLLIGFLADTVFRWAASTARSFQTEVGQYMESQGLLGREGTTKAARR